MALSMGTYTPASNNTGYQSPASTGFQGAPAIGSIVGPTASVSGAPRGFDVAPGTVLKGNYNYNSNNITSGSEPTSPTTSPVITAQSAQDDYNQKFATFQNLLTSVKDQTTNLSQQQAYQAQQKAATDLQAAQLKLQQQGVDNQTAEINAKNYALKLAGDQGSISPESTGGTATTPAPGGTGSTTSTTGAPGGTDTTNSALSGMLNQYGSQMSDIGNQRDTLNNQIQTQLSSLLQGTIPLSAPQQALITSLQSQLTINVAAQTQANTADVGVVQEAAMRAGGEYTPQQMAGQIQSAVSNGVAKIQALDNSAATTMAQLEQSFQKDNFDIINQQFTDLSKTLDDKSTAITDMYNAATKSLQDQRDYNLKVSQFNQDQQLKQQQFSEQVKKDAADIHHQNISDSIAAANLKLSQATFNATYGIFTDSSGNPVTAGNIPGTTKGENGVSYMDLSQFTDPKQATGAANLARHTGMPIITTAQAPAVRAWQSVNSLLTTVQTQYNQLNSGKLKPGPITDAGNPVYASFQQNVANLNAALKDLGTKDPSFVTLGSTVVPNLGWIGSFTGTNNNIQTKLNTLNDGLRSSMNAMIPNMPTPLFGQTFTSPAEMQTWADATGNDQVLNNLKASYPNATAEDILKIINTGQEPTKKP